MSGFAVLTPQREYQIAWDLVYENMSVKDTAAKYYLSEDQVLEIQTRADRILETYEDRVRERKEYEGARVKHVLVFLLFLVLFFPIALAYMWAQTPWRMRTKVIITLLMIVPCVQAAITFIHLDRQYRVEVSNPGFTSPQPKLKEREHLGATVQQYAEFFRGIDDHPLGAKKQEWLTLFADQWVLWDGYLVEWEDDETVLMKTPLGKKLKVEVRIPPIERKRFRLRMDGRRVTVSGRIVAAHFLWDRVTLSDAFLANFEY